MTRHIGYFGGSFDPPTVAHMHSAKNLAQLYGLDLVLLGPCSNQRDDKKMKVDDIHRLRMLELAIDGDPMFSIDTHEMHQDASKVFSYFTMEYLKSQYPNDELYFMMGADLLVSIGNGDWEYGRAFVEHNRFLVTSREGVNLRDVVKNSPFLHKHKDNFTLFQQAEDIRISSTYIRSELYNHRNPRYLLPPGVYEYIKEHKLYV